VTIALINAIKKISASNKLWKCSAEMEALALWLSIDIHLSHDNPLTKPKNTKPDLGKYNKLQVARKDKQSCHARLKTLSRR